MKTSRLWGSVKICSLKWCPFRSFASSVSRHRSRAESSLTLFEQGWTGLSGWIFQLVLNKLTALRGGPDDTWGGGYGFFPLCKLFFSLLTRNKLFFLSGKGTRKIFSPSYNPIFLPVLWTNVFFFTVFWTNYFLSFCRIIFSFKKKT